MSKRNKKPIKQPKPELCPSSELCPQCMDYVQQLESEREQLAGIVETDTIIFKLLGCLAVLALAAFCICVSHEA